MLSEGMSLSALITTITLSEELKPRKFVKTRVKVYAAFVSRELSTVMG